MEATINVILAEMQPVLIPSQLKRLKVALERAFVPQNNETNAALLKTFLTAKEVEGCSLKTLEYYESTLQKMTDSMTKPYTQIDSNDLRKYLNDYEASRGSSKVTIDNIRRIMSSFFSWLEDEDYIVKSPVRRIKRVKTAVVTKETFTDEQLEIVRESCGNALETYLANRRDTSPALFVSLDGARRVTTGSIERTMRKLGNSINVGRVHPHKFRRTLATHAIDKGMPIEQVQKLLGHAKIETTMHYAMVNQNNVKASHRKYLE